jgi:TolB protein
MNHVTSPLNRKTPFALLLAILAGYGLLFVASSSSQKTTVDYTPATVMEEGGINFVEYTSDDESVAGPAIFNDARNNLNWYSAPMIEVSKDSSFLAYKCSKNNATNVFLRKLSGGKNIIQRTFRNAVVDFAISNDCKSIAFTDNSDGSSNIYQMNVREGAAVQQITSTSASENGPAYSIDDKQIFFTKSENSNQIGDPTRYYIWSFNRESSLLTQYNEGFNPTAHPDGKRILICRTNKVTSLGEIWAIDLISGQESQLLSDKEKGFSSPAVSPDGKRIVCVGSTKKTKTKRANLDLYLLNIDGTGFTQLTFHPGHDVSPRWSPDNKSIFFISQRGNSKGNWNVWKMTIR